MMEYNIESAIIELRQGDITKQTTDCIVNAANSDLAHGGGVAKAIASAAGEELLKASKEAPHVPTGEVYTTPGGNLYARWVIHAVGPIWQGGQANEREKLVSAIENSLKEAVSLGGKSISFPAISTGIYGYPIQNAAKIILDTTINYLSSNHTLNRVQFVLFTKSDFDIFVSVLEELL